MNTHDPFDPVDPVDPVGPVGPVDPVGTVGPHDLNDPGAPLASGHTIDADETRLLAACLAAIDAGALPADTLGAEPDPDRRVRLAPLVATALSLRDASYGALRPAFKARMEDTLAALERDRVGADIGRDTADVRRVPPGAAARDSSWRVGLRWAALVALAAGLTGLAYAAVRSGPGDGLHPLRALVDRLGVDSPALSPVPTPSMTSPTHVPRQSSDAASQLQRPGSEEQAKQPATARANARSTRPTAIVAAPPTPPPSAPSTTTATAQMLPPDRPHPKPPTPSSPTATHAPTTPSPTIPAGVAIRGTVSQAGGPLANMTIIAWHRPMDAGCSPDDIVQVATATTDADGRFAFSGLPPGTYLLSAEAGGTCLPRRWSGGAIELAVADPCGAAHLVLTRDGDATGTTNVAYAAEEVGGCP